MIGYPLHMDGSRRQEGQARWTIRESLEHEFGLPVRKVDERLTSLAAEEALGKKVKPEDGKIDAAAAGLILKDFLEGGKGIE